MVQTETNLYLKILVVPAALAASLFMSWTVGVGAGLISFGLYRLLTMVPGFS